MRNLRDLGTKSATGNACRLKGSSGKTTPDQSLPTTGKLNAQAGPERDPARNLPATHDPEKTQLS
jgi:hypothetical protein